MEKIILVRDHFRSPSGREYRVVIKERGGIRPLYTFRVVTVKENGSWQVEDIQVLDEKKE